MGKSVRMRGAHLISALMRFAEGWLAPILFLGIRLWMANIFFRSGLLKIQDLDGATFLFSEVHPVPFLPPWLAAYLATTFELGCSALLALGLAARLAALPMLAMALVIQFLVGAHANIGSKCSGATSGIAPLSVRRWRVRVLPSLYLNSIESGPGRRPESGSMPWPKPLGQLFIARYERSRLGPLTNRLPCS
jgi:uncharacterized membrane protein YphA (DoxX/SURF4 family)